MINWTYFSSKLVSKTIRYEAWIVFDFVFIYECLYLFISSETFPVSTKEKQVIYIKNVAADGFICMCVCNHRAIAYL